MMGFPITLNQLQDIGVSETCAVDSTPVLLQAPLAMVSPSPWSTPGCKWRNTLINKMQENQEKKV
jgi:hypothetical protein